MSEEDFRCKKCGAPAPESLECEFCSFYKILPPQVELIRCLLHLDGLLVSRVSEALKEFFVSLKEGNFLYWMEHYRRHEEYLNTLQSEGETDEG